MSHSFVPVPSLECGGCSAQLPILDGFTVTRFTDANQTTAVTVDGAHGALLSNLVVPVGPSTVNSYGVNLIDGAQALIWASRIDGGSTGIITGEADSS